MQPLITTRVCATKYPETFSSGCSDEEETEDMKRKLDCTLCSFHGVVRNAGPVTVYRVVSLSNAACQKATIDAEALSLLPNFC